MFKWFKKPEQVPPLVLVAVSKPNAYLINKEPILVELYVQGTTRSWKVSGSVQRDLYSTQPTIELDFWVRTGKFEPASVENNFEWVLSPLQLKKHLLAEILKSDPDPKPNDK